jgi:hypothetical protein
MSMAPELKFLIVSTKNMDSNEWLIHGMVTPFGSVSQVLQN